MTPAHTLPANGIATERLVLRQTARSNATALLAYYQANRAHLAPWEPLRPQQFYTREAIDERLAEMARRMAAGTALSLLLCEPLGGRIIGECNFTNMVRGPFQACYLGFTIDARDEGKGLMREALAAAIGYVFEKYGLHRIMANHMPANQRSGQLLARLGFEVEGRARAYLKINGAWEDHVLTALIAPGV
jgi:ribosomal-protein-alanine N-acetyltransferase